METSITIKDFSRKNIERYLYKEGIKSELAAIIVDGIDYSVMHLLSGVITLQKGKTYSLDEIIALRYEQNKKYKVEKILSKLHLLRRCNSLYNPDKIDIMLYLMKKLNTISISDSFFLNMPAENFCKLFYEDILLPYKKYIEYDNKIFEGDRIPTNKEWKLCKQLQSQIFPEYGGWVNEQQAKMITQKLNDIAPSR